MHQVFLGIALSIVCLQARAAFVEMVEPSETCQRFLSKKEQQNCLKVLKDSSEDSYLAAICDRQDNDKAFLDCMKLAKKYSFDPKKIQSCGRPSMEDQERIACLSQTGTLTASREDRRLPASANGKPR